VLCEGAAKTKHPITFPEGLREVAIQQGSRVELVAEIGASSMSKSTLVGKCFITKEHYYTLSGVRPSGFCGDVLSNVGSNSYLIRRWDDDWSQIVVPVSFFIEANARSSCND
jgi:hypothetical protein